MRILILAVVAAAPAIAAAQCPARPSLHAWFDLPRDDERRHGLSGIVWDDGRRVLWAVSDSRPSIVALVPDAGFRSFAFGETVTLPFRMSWDAEAVALGDEGFFVGAEAGPAVLLVGRDGRKLRDVALPPPFRRSRHNHGLESAALTPDRATLFVANEHAFEGDGGLGDATLGTVVRLVRMPARGAGAAEQFAYRTDPVFHPGAEGRVGVVDVTPLSATRLLVTERHFVPAAGNAVRVHCVDLAGAADVSARESLERDPPVVAKALVLDLATLPATGVPPRQAPQPNPLLDNFEGLALGPRLPDGRRLLFAISDDNARPTQVARVLVLAYQETP
jgi:hypothetical protein